MLRLSVAALLLSLLTTGLAQEALETARPSAYAGASLAFVYIFPVAHGHVGDQDALAEGFGVRGDLALGVPFGIGLGGNVTYHIDLDFRSSLYVGAGPRLVIGFGSGARLFGFEFDTGGPRLFAELEGDMMFAAPTTIAPVARFGVLFPF